MDEVKVFSNQSDFYIRRCVRKICKLRNLYIKKHFSGTFTSWTLTTLITFFILLFFSDSPFNPINASSIILGEDKNIALFFLDPIKSFTLQAIWNYFIYIITIVLYSILIALFIFFLLAFPTALYVRGNSIIEGTHDSLSRNKDKRSFYHHFQRSVLRLFLDRADFLISDGQERIFPSYFVLVIIFMLIIIFRLTPFLEDRYASLSLLTSLLGAAYIYLLIGLSFIFHVIHRSIARRIIEDQLKLKFFDEYMIWKLHEIVNKVSNQRKWKNLDHRLNISYSLLEIGRMFRDYAPRVDRRLDALGAVSYRNNMNNIYNKFRYISTWPLTPKVDTRLVIRSKLEEILAFYAVTDVDSLMIKNDEEIEYLSSRKVLESQLGFWIRKGFRILAPVFLVWLFTLTPLSPSGSIKDYLTSGSFALSGLMTMAELDPNFGDKLSLLKTLKDLFKK